MATEFPAGTIPARGFDWDAVVFPPRRVGDFADLAYGKGLVEGSRRPGNVPVFGTNGRCGWHDSALRSSPGLILGRKGQGPLGVEWCDEPFWVIDTAYVASVIPSEADLKWFYYVTKYVGLNHLKTGEKPGLQRDTFRAQLFPFPEKPVQQAIASVLSTLDDKIQANHKTNNALEALASALFKSWFVDFDPVTAKRDGKAPVSVPADLLDSFPSHFEDSELGPIPQAWHIARLGDLAELNARTLSPKDVPSEIQYVEISDVHRGNVENIAVYARGSEPSRARRIVRDGDTIVSAVRPERGAYFLCLEPPPNLVVSTGFVVLTPHSDRWALVYCAATSDDALDYYELRADGGAYPAMRPEVVDNLRLAMPHGDAICECFSSIVNPLLKYAHANRTESGRLAQLRDTLLPPLLSGEITVKTAAETVAEVV